MQTKQEVKYELRTQKNPTIAFYDGHGNWVMKIEKGKIFFNRENWSECEPDAFAKAVIEILERAVLRMGNWEKYKETLNNEV